MIIRWLGAFGYGSSLKDSLDWEFSSPNRERAAEMLQKNQKSMLANKCGIGLLFNKTSVTKKFPGDVWSVPSLQCKKQMCDSRFLVATRKPCKHSYHKHNECFLSVGAKPTGIILSSVHLKKIEQNASLMSAIYDVADKEEVWVYLLTDKGTLVKYY